MEARADRAARRAAVLAMMLLELFQAVKEQHLTKTQLMEYQDQLSSLFAEMNLELADIEKEEAMFFYNRMAPDVSDVSIKRAWRATEKGQRQILLNRYLKATSKILQSLKSRLYEFI